MLDRKGKTKLLRNRLYGLGKKVLSRNSHACPLEQSVISDGIEHFNAADSLLDLKNGLLKLLDERTLPKCPKINQNLKRKIVKIVTKAQNQTFSKTNSKN